MKFTSNELSIARSTKTKREWVRTEWRSVESIAKEHGVCYSTWYDRVAQGQTPERAASYAPCPYKGRKMKKRTSKSERN